MPHIIEALLLTVCRARIVTPIMGVRLDAMNRSVRLAMRGTRCGELRRGAATYRPEAAPLRPLVVDMHTHFLPATWPDFAVKHGGEEWPWMRHSGEHPDGVYGYERKCSAMLMQGSSDFRPVTSACWSPADRIFDMDAAGIDFQLISATPILFQWHRPAEVAADVARHFNDAALEMCASPEAQGRLLALCQVPLQDVDLACREAERAMAAGCAGVHIGNHVGDQDLDADELVAFLNHCASIKAPVLVHPWDMDDMHGRLSKNMMGKRPRSPVPHAAADIGRPYPDGVDSQHTLSTPI